MECSKNGYSLCFEKKFSADTLEKDVTVLEFKKETEKQKISNGPSFVDETKKILNESDYVHYKKENVSANENALVLSATNNGDVYYGSAVSVNGVKIKRGLVEVDVQFPAYMPGVWPRLTLKGKNGTIDTYINFAQIMGVAGKNLCSMEAEYLDNGEWPFKQNFLHSHRGEWPTSYPEKESEELLSEGTHTFGVELSNEHITYYADGNEYCKIHIDNPVFEVFNCEHELVFYLTVGDSETEAPDENTLLPCEMLIKGIRIYGEGEK